MDEQLLIDGCMRGESWARKELYEQYAPAMMSVCMRYVGDRETARDLLQDGFVKIFTKIRSYSGSGAFGGWIRRIFVTTALEYLRSSENTRLSVGLDGYDDSLEDINYSVLDRLSADDLLACVAQLPSGYRTVFNLYAIEGYTHSEIAEMLDDFSGYMRQRLEEHRLPVDAGCWDEVEARMNRRARPWGWLWTGGLAAAAVLALVIWLLPSPEKMPLEEMNILPERPVLPVEPVKKRIAKVLKWEKKAKLSAIVGEKETIREDEKCETIEIIEKDAIAAIVEEPSVKEDASEDSTDIVVKRGDSTVPLPEGERSPRRKASLKKKAKKSKRNKWLLAAAVGSSGYVDSFLNTDMSYGDASSPGDMNNSAGSPDPDKPDKDDDEKESGNTPPQTVSFRNAPVLRSSKVDENFLDNRSFESYPDVSYSLPISFGFTVRKDLSRRIAVESGLMYTYLSTTFKRGGDCPSEVKSSLHYLGIPLNLVVYVWKNQRWNVYLSGGFMMEKGLQAVYSGYIAGNGTTLSKSKKEGIHGMQWSVNASVGAAYRFYGDWSLYFEPRFSHYFDCDQPASIRTDKPLGFGLSAGIRYAF